MSGAAGYTCGQRLRLGQFGPVTRANIARFCGASGDFAAFHIDEPAAQAAGYRSVFAPGMLTLGLVGRLVAAEVGPPNLSRLGGRFLSVVWPGDTLTVGAEVTAITPQTVSFAVTVTNQDDHQVLTGYADATLAGVTSRAAS
jgi:acyl dehydratase